jgi:hypothetical protein
MGPGHRFKIEAIRARIEFCEAERRQILKMVTISQVSLAWISERMESIERELRFLRRDLDAQEKREWN